MNIKAFPSLDKFQTYLSEGLMAMAFTIKACQGMTVEVPFEEHNGIFDVGPLRRMLMFRQRNAGFDMVLDFRKDHLMILMPQIILVIKRVLNLFTLHAIGYLTFLKVFEKCISSFG